jgi:6-pyruvoyltetrahydropterin/6-carboxytetrahydropterin synthase
MEKITLCKVFAFDSAHKLPFYKGKCSNLHGHTWKLIVKVEGELDKKSGMVVDFLEIKKGVEDSVISKLDHSYLNDTIENPTCENLLIWIKSQLKGLKGLKKLVLYETEKSFAELEC